MAEEPVVSQEAQGSYIAQATGGGTATIQVYASPPSLENQNRARFLMRLRTRYRDLLSQSLHGAVRLTLELAGSPDAVTPPVRLLSQPDQQPTRLLPAGTSLSQVYADAGHELLVLGEPGAGKSTLLLELALDLVGMAERDHSQLLPVIVPLSSWASKRRPLEQWLAEQIALLYDLPRRLSERWVREERLLPLLDGLDEMDEEARATCIAAINAYHREHLHPLVVASRKTEYEAAVTLARLVLHSAVTVQPLTLGQIEAYLEQAGEPLHALRAALHRDATLCELTSTPLMLSILILTYHGLSVEELFRGAAPTDRQRQIFEHYVERMLRHRGAEMRSPHERTLHWLAWLARQMKQHNQTVFYIEHLQPDWLPEGRARSWYERLATRGAGIVIGVVVSLLVTTLFFVGVSLPNEIWYGCAGGLVGGLISGSGTSGFQLKGIRHLCFQRWRSLILLGVLNGVLVGGLVAAGLALWGSPHSPYDWLIDGGSLGLCGSLLAIIIVSGKRIAQQGISSVPRPYWWHGFLPQGFQSDHLRLGIMVGLLLGLSVGLSEGLSAGLSEGLLFGLGVGLNYGLSDGLIFGTIGVFLSLLLLGRKSTIELAEILVWSGKRIGRSLVSKHHLSASARILLLAFLFFGLSFGLSDGLLFGLNDGLSDGLSSGLSVGLSSGLSVGLSEGLSAGLSVGSAYWLLVGLWNGLSRETLDDHLRTRPNQGIAHSVRSALLVGLPAGAICFLLGPLTVFLSGFLFVGLSNWLLGWLLAWLRTGLSNVGVSRFGLSTWLSTGLILGCMGALLAALLTGGLASLRHLLLRLQLRRLGAIPQHYVRFLDDAARRVFLYKDGGGYRFIHRLFLDYLADLETSPLTAQPGMPQSEQDHRAEPKETAHQSSEHVHPPSTSS